LILVVRSVSRASWRAYLARAPVHDAITSGDTKTITSLRGSFGKLTPDQLVGIIKAFDKTTWVDWDDEKTIEMAWRHSVVR
jgi:hypothetical protein